MENFGRARNTSTCLVVVSLLFAVVAREGLEGLGGPLALEGLLARVVVLEGLGGLLIISGLFSSSVDVSQFSDSLAARLVRLWFCLLRSCRRDTVRAGSVRGSSTSK
jgi:hypothetical protein